MQSKQQRSKMFFVRVDGRREFLIEKLRQLEQAIDTVKLLSLAHIGSAGENPHCHFVIQIGADIQLQSFRERIKVLFQVQKKTEFSVKIWDGADPACSYMFHELDEVILSVKGYTDDDINRFRELNKKVQEVVAINKTRGGGRLVDRVVEEFRDERPDRKDILVNLILKIRDGEMYEPGDYQLSKYVEEIYLKTTGKYHIDDYCEERYRKLFLR